MVFYVILLCWLKLIAFIVFYSNERMIYITLEEEFSKNVCFVWILKKTKIFLKLIKLKNAFKIKKSLKNMKNAKSVNNL